jgi:SAM-dependent methyltransferase
MEKITTPTKPRENKYIFTEGIDYFTTSKEPIWGTGDKDTLKVLENTKIKGKWLNLASGDGRYNLKLLENADFVISSDIDKSALSKLRYNTPEKFKSKLKLKSFNLTNRFPFESESFDGIFCTGTLHLFPKNILLKIISEIDRILKPNGKIIIDFATNIKRTSPCGKLIIFGKEPLYNLNDAKIILREFFKEYQIEMHEFKVIESFEGANPPYKLECNFIVLIADKK